MGLHFSRRKSINKENVFDVAQENTAETSTVRAQRDEGVESETSNFDESYFDSDVFSFGSAQDHLATIKGMSCHLRSYNYAFAYFN